MLISWMEGHFPMAYVPTVLDNYVTTCPTGNPNSPTIKVDFWDTAGQEAYEDLVRFTFMEPAHAVILCFDVTSPNSFENVKGRWMEILNKVRSSTTNRFAIVLAGLQVDKRLDDDIIDKMKARGQYPIGREKAEDLAREIGADAYRECSALTSVGLEGVFHEAVKAGVAVKAKLEASRKNPAVAAAAAASGKKSKKKKGWFKW